MTRKQAIKELTELLPEEFLMEYSEAIKMGIEALEQEPCEDCISREKVCKILDRSWLYGLVAQRVIDQIKYLPFVTSQQKMGRWIILKDEYDDVCEAICSCCDKNGNHKWAFCPFCGAKMSENPTGSERNEK